MISARPRALTMAVAATVALVAAAPAAASTTAVFARRPSVALRLRAPVKHVRTVGYHQAASTRALALTPVGRLRTNRAAKRYEPPRDRPGPSYVVMRSRRRGTPATSAADVAVRAGRAIRSPVTGTVREVGRYRLYGRYRDRYVKLKPRGRPRLRVVVLHINGVGVRRGDRVRAGRTRIADTARQLPFRSQIDKWVGRRGPHVHVEIRAIP